MAIALDGAATSILVTTNPITLSWTSGSGADQLLIVGVSWDNRNAQTISGVTWNGNALTFIGLTEHTGTKAAHSFWYLKSASIAASTTANVVVSFTGTASGKPYIAGAVSYSGVDQTTPVSGYVGATSATSPLSVTVTSATGELVFSGVTAYKASVIAVNGGETLRWSQANGTEAGGGSDEAGAATVVMDWAITSGGAMNTVTGFSIKDAGPTGPQASGAITDGSDVAAGVADVQKISITHVFRNEADTAFWANGINVVAYKASTMSAAVPTVLGNAAIAGGVGSVTIDLAENVSVVLVPDHQHASAPTGEQGISEALTPTVA